jgi:uncharacterized protein (TIGR00296 family)
LISIIDGAELVRLARTAVEKYLQESIMIEPKETPEKSGVFVTVNYVTRSKEEHLRGCIGFPLPEKSLYQGVIEAAIAAATEDPRFPPLDARDLNNIIFEVSVLSPPQEIKVNNSMDFMKEIKIGRDGLILRWRFGSGLLLPQVPIELKWDIEVYVANICYKAGAPPDLWLDPDTKLYKFQATVFKEIQPKGEIIKVEL